MLGEEKRGERREDDEAGDAVGDEEDVDFIST